jgi:hypothetical protein
VVEQVARETGKQPLVVGMNADRLSSWLAFYRSRAMARDGAENTGAAALDTAGPDLFGREGHMYGLWFPRSLLKGDRPLILVGDDPALLDVEARRRQAGPIEEITAWKNGQLTWRIYYRVLD